MARRWGLWCDGCGRSGCVSCGGGGDGCGNGGGDGGHCGDDCGLMTDEGEGVTVWRRRCLASDSSAGGGVVVAVAAEEPVTVVAVPVLCGKRHGAGGSADSDCDGSGH